jgi:hypothetical protein
LCEKSPQVLSLAIRHSGKAKANEVYLIAEEGLTEVSGTIEGQVVHLLGDAVHLLAEALDSFIGKYPKMGFFACH